MRLNRDAASILTDADSGLQSDLESLGDADVRAFIQLGGVALENTESTYRLVWALRRALVYPRECVNPLGTAYSFLDDEEYDSLSD